MTLAIVLAAGRGRRIGAGKALLDLRGRSALELCLSALREGGVGALVVVLGADAAAVRAAVPLRDDEVVINDRPERGQTSSLRAALTRGHRADTAFLLHPVDHPLLLADDVAALLAAFATRAPGRRIVLPEVAGRRGHPAVFEAALADEFLALSDEQPAHDVVRREAERVLTVPRDNPWLVRDIDTPEDLAAAREAQSIREQAAARARR